VEEALYHRAHIANVYTGISDPKEHETSALMEVILYSNIFTTGDNFMVNSQQPPAPQSDKRCDIVIRYLEHGTQKIRILCFAECKRTRTSQKFSLKALEKQASEYCRLCLDSEEDMPFVYAATMAGAHVRLWTYFRDQAELVPFWGPPNGGEWAQYKDVGDDKAGQDIEYWFGQMKHIPPTPHAGQSNETYGTSKTFAQSYPQASVLSYQAPASRSQASGTTQQRISDWSEWTWNAEHKCEYRYRENPASRGGWDYEYRSTIAEPSGSAASAAGYEAGPSKLGPGYTVTYPIREVPSQGAGETEAKAEEHYPVVPDDAIYVEVKLEARDSSDLFHFHHEGQHYTKEDSEWEERTVIVHGKRYECFLSTEKKTGKHFWTYSLQDVEPYETGKGKEKKKRGGGKV